MEPATPGSGRKTRRPVPVQEWFAALGDGEPALDAARMIGSRATTTIRHASGRPWLLGRWSPDTVVVASAGRSRAAIIGRGAIGQDELTRRLGRVRDVDDVERLVDGVAGSFHLVASIGGRVRVRGSASAVRQVFHTRLAGVTVACSRADVLAAAAGAGIDERVMAARLLPVPVYRLYELPIWHGVHRLDPGDCLLIDGDGGVRSRCWWRVPEPVLSAEEGAVLVREALRAAVGSSTATGGTVSADLSGGLDSTSLCFLAADGPARLVTAHRAPLDAANDDRAWAGRAAAALPPARHLVFEPGLLPLWFAEANGAPPPTDEPHGWVRDWALMREVAERMAGEGSRLHLIGGGGDELFAARPHYLHDLFRTRPWQAFTRLRAQPAGGGQPLWRRLARLADRTDFPTWLNRLATDLAIENPVTSVSPGSAVEVFSPGWGPVAPMPCWTTEHALHAVRDLLRQLAAQRPEPLSPLRGQHTTLYNARLGGDGLRQIDQAATAIGLPHAAPILDDAVITAVLSIRTDQRGAPGRYKPVLAAAMRSVVPEPLLSRSTKGNYAAEWYAGMRRHGGELLEVFGDSALARLGLIDAAVLRDFLSRPHPRLDPLYPLVQTLGCEIWLRASDQAGRRPATGHVA
ncbi:asparagine synthase-related protein [Streptosporangium sp. NPDC020145]|uniref:asparagine synthase-related protein n=1 Tax=Streptosporangium sp. NPDC020145 TaxID=3154694 RepID=UPI00343AA07F